ncbi:uncharacterized protein LOC144437474 [Glandiceps talaboti]
MSTDDFWREIIMPPLTENMYFIEYDGKNITTFLPDNLFHENVTEALYKQVYKDVSNVLLYNIFINIFNHDSDDVGSDFYNQQHSQALASKMNFDKSPWDSLNVTINKYLNHAKETSEGIAYPIVYLFNGYYLPLFDVVFPIIYSTLRDLRLDMSIKVFQDEDSSAICQSYMKDNLAKVTIYFEDLKVESIEQQPGYHSFNLVCDIGGSLGLFFGASMVTFLEILDFFIVQFWRMKIKNKVTTE